MESNLPDLDENGCSIEKLSDNKHTVQKERTWIEGTILYHESVVKNFIKKLKGRLREGILNNDGVCELDYYETLDAINELAGDELI